MAHMFREAGYHYQEKRTAEYMEFKAAYHVKCIHKVRHITIQRGETSNFNTQKIYQDSSHASIGDYKSVSKILNYGPRFGLLELVDSDVEYISQLRSDLDADTRWMVDLNSQLAEWFRKLKEKEEQDSKRHEELLAENKRLKEARQTEHSSALSDVINMTNEQIYKDLREAREKNNKLKVKELEQRDQYDSLKYRFRIFKDSLEKMDKEIIRLRKDNTNVDVKILLHQWQIKGLEEQEIREQKLVKSLRQELRECRNRLNKATIAHIRSEHAKYSVIEHISFVEIIKQLEISYLRQVQQSSVISIRDWDTEMTSALQEIRALYDGRMGTLRQELTYQYELRVEQFTYERTDTQLVIIRDEVERQREEIAHLRAELNEDHINRIDELRMEIQMRKYSCFEIREKYRREFTEIMRERKEWHTELAGIRYDLEHIIVSKHNLEMEIKVYELLLEVLYKSKEQIKRELKIKQEKVNTGKPLAITYKRQRNLDIQPGNIHETIRVDRRYLHIPNPTKENWDVSNFKLSRVKDGQEIDFLKFPAHLVVPPNEEITIWASGKTPPNKTDKDLDSEFTPSMMENSEWIVYDARGNEYKYDEL